MVAVKRSLPTGRHYSGTRSVGVSLTEVFASGLRLEASAFALEARQAVEEINASGYPVRPILGETGICASAHNAFRFKRIYVDAEHGIPFLSSSDIIGLRPERGRYLSLKHIKDAKKLKIKPWDILISRSGTIGNVGLASPRLENWALSEDVIRLTAPSEHIAGYITAFLRTQWGKAQLDGATYGSVIQHIEPHHLENIYLPDLPSMLQRKIGDSFVQAAILRDKANDLFDEAERLLQETLKLPPFPMGKNGPLISTPRLSAWRGRFDASFHSPQALWMEKQLNNIPYQCKTLGDVGIAQVRAVTKFRKRVYVPKGGIPLLSSKQLFQIAPVGIKGLAHGAHLDDMDEIALKKNYLIVTCSGTIGRILLTPSYMDGWASNQHSLRIISKNDLMAGYLYAWLSSSYGQALIKRFSYGSVILEFDRFMAAEIPVPLPSTHEIEAISQLVLTGNSYRDEAWTQEQDALTTLASCIKKKTTGLA